MWQRSGSTLWTASELWRIAERDMEEERQAAISRTEGCVADHP